MGDLVWGEPTLLPSSLHSSKRVVGLEIIDMGERATSSTHHPGVKQLRKVLRARVPSAAQLTWRQSPGNQSSLLHYMTEIGVISERI